MTERKAGKGLVKLGAIRNDTIIVVYDMFFMGRLIKLKYILVAILKCCITLLSFDIIQRQISWICISVQCRVSFKINLKIA